MKRTLIKDLSRLKEKRVRVEGFVHEIRDQKHIKFLLIRDRSGIIQAIITEDKPFFKDIPHIPRESVIRIEGTVKAEAQAPGGIELVVEAYTILSQAEKPLPIPVVEKGVQPSLSKRLDYRWLDLRKPKHRLIFEIWTFMERAMREWWAAHDFIQIYSPKLMGTASESGAELFHVDYFGRDAYLAQSPQFYKQMAMAAGFERIFEIGPVFRANPSHTSRHDTEFTMIDMEVSFIDSHEDIMRIEEDWLHYVLKRIREEYGQTIRDVYGVEVVVPSLPFPRIPFHEAMRIIRQRGYEGPEDDLDPSGERLISAYVQETFGHEFVFITDYPWSIRPFYHMRHEEDKSLTKSYDLLWKGLEITTGAQREHRYEILRRQAEEKGLSLPPLKDYLSFFRWGVPPHGGFAVSPTRLLMLLLGFKNVREVTYLPRDPKRLHP